MTARVGAIRPTAKELAYLTRTLETAIESGAPREAGTLLAKAVKATEPRRGVDVRPLEDALAATAPDKFARLEGGGYARASRLAADLGAEPEGVAEIGRWVDGQGWLPAVTLLGVLENWHKWLPLARKWGTPMIRRSGLGDLSPRRPATTTDVGQVPDLGGPSAPGRRRPGGFR